jgi:hypothetical protein
MVYDIRYVVRHGWDGPEQVLQVQLVDNQEKPTEWLDVLVVDLTAKTTDHHAQAGGL